MTNANIHQDYNELWKGQEELAVLTFSLNGEVFAIEAVVVQEILDLLPETPVPGSLPYVGSIVNFRGKVIPLADIRIAFGMPTAETTIDSRIVVIELELEGEPTLIGIRTDKVFEVTSLSRKIVEPPPVVGMRWRTDYVHAIAKREGEFIIIPKLHAIFASERGGALKAIA